MATPTPTSGSGAADRGVEAAAVGHGRRERRRELAARPEDQALDRTLRGLQRGRDLGVAGTLQLAHDDGLALLLGQLLECAAQRDRVQALLECLVDRARRCDVDAVERAS